MDVSSLNWVLTIITIVGSIAASTGFWAYMSKRDTKHTALEKLVLGLAQQQIVTRGMQYIDRGWLTADEYDDFIKILYQPYADFGGNGMGEKVMNDVMKLPIRGTPPAGAFQLVTEEKRA